jgi:urea transport system substrate-binding protein
MTSGQVVMMGGPGSLSDPRATPGPDTSQQGQPPQTRTTMLVGGALLLALFAVVLVSFKLFQQGGPHPAGIHDAGPVHADLPAPPSPPKPPIKVGVLNSLSGTMAISSRPIVEATLLAIDEINAAGGLLGRRIEPILVDGKSINQTFVHETERLIKEEKVVTIFGGWTPSNRREMKEVVEKYDHLLVFPSRDEGLEDSPNIIYNGSTLKQQVVPAVLWALDKLGSKRFFIVGSDGLLGRMSTELIKDTIKDKGAKVVDERFVLLSETNFRPVIKKIIASKADLIFNMVNGDSNVPFFRELRAAGIVPSKVPTISFSISESELPQLEGVDMVGDYLGWSYFETVDRPQNKVFVDSFKKKYGQYRGISDPMEAAYFGVHLWAQAVRAAGSDDVRAIRRALQNQSYEAPSSLVRIEPSNNHTWKMFRMGKIVSPKRIEVVYSSEALLPPEPFPSTRTRAEWEQLLKYLYGRWGDSWVNKEQPVLIHFPGSTKHGGH